MSTFTTLSDAIARFVRPGHRVALEGFTHLIPFAAGHEIIRQGLTDLTLVRMTPDLLYDQMIGSGCARKLVFSWGGNPGVGSLHRLRDAVERGWPRPLEIEEHSHSAMAHAYAAGAAGMPSAFFRGYFGSDLAKVNPNIKFIDCPFTGERLASVPAHRPDVTIVHAQKADRSGNVLLEGIIGVQKEAVLAARAAIVTVEEIVDRFEGLGTNAVILPSWTVNAIVAVPGGAHPSYAHGYYARDNAFYVAWDAISRDRDSFQRWIDGARDDRAARDVRRARARGRSAEAGMTGAPYTAAEMMTVAAARALGNDDICFVGIGLPSAACNLARLTHAPRLTLVYESGTLETKPTVLPLSIGDGELCETALTTVSVPEMFQDLAAGRAHLGRLPWRRADRPLRQPEQHRHRPLRQAQSPPARERRRDRDRDRLSAHLRRDAPQPASVRADAGLRHLARTWGDRPRAARDGNSHRRPDAGRDRPVHDDARRGDEGVRGREPAPRRHPRTGTREYGLGRPFRRAGRRDAGAQTIANSRRYAT